MSDHAITAQEPTLQERLRGPAYWFSGSGQGPEGVNDVPYLAADRVDELEAALASMTEDRDLWKQSEATCSAQYDKLLNSIDR